MSDNVKNTSKKQGFAGLVDLASDLSEEISAHARPATGSQNNDQEESLSTAHPVYPPTQKTSSNKSNDNYLSSGRPRSYISQVCYVAIGVILVCVVVDKCSSPSSKSSTDIISKQAQPSSTAASSQFKSNSSSQSIAYEKPPVANGLLLNVYQIRYCLTEGVKLDAIRGVAQSSSNADINRFNFLVDDYNSRCSNYKYHKKDFNLVQQEVNSRRQEIYRNAQSDWVNGNR